MEAEDTSSGAGAHDARRRATDLVVDPELRRLNLRRWMDAALEALTAGDGPKAVEKLRFGIAFDDADDAFLPDDLEQRSTADARHTEHVREWMDEGLSPEEWVARNSDYLLADDSDRFRYADPALDDWVHRVFAILQSLPLREMAKERHLTPEERARIEADAREALAWF
jgi:hypothetical protein